MVDYSKWDNLDLSDDSDSEEPAPPERLKGQPRVTRLEPGTTVTMGPEGITAVAPPTGGFSGTVPGTKRAALADGPKPTPAPAPAPAAKKQGGVLDYSKWDNLAVSDSDESEEQVHKQSASCL